MTPADVLHVLTDPPLDGPTNMARDEHLLYCDAFRPAALRLYRWDPPTLSLGYFQRLDEVAALPAEMRSLAVVRRTTGGGAILHDDEITYCLMLDDSLAAARAAPAALYRLVHECFRGALATVGAVSELASDELPFPSPRGGPFFCFEKPGRTDLLFGGRKVLGSAQRRAAGRVLQHGSLILSRRFRHPGADLGGPSVESVQRILDAFVERLAADLGLHPRKCEWSRESLLDVAERREKYASLAWLRLR